MTFPFGQSVILCSRTRVTGGPRGNDTWTETQTTYNNCPTWPAASAEILQGQDMVYDGIQVLFPTGPVIAATDQLILAGVRYNIVGNPNLFQSPFTGTSPGQVVQAQVVTG